MRKYTTSERTIKAYFLSRRQLIRVFRFVYVLNPVDDVDYILWEISSSLRTSLVPAVDML